MDFFLFLLSFFFSPFSVLRSWKKKNKAAQISYRTSGIARCATGGCNVLCSTQIKKSAEKDTHAKQANTNVCVGRRRFQLRKKKKGKRTKVKPANQLRRACATVLLMCSRDVTRTHTHTQKKDRHLCNGGFYFLSFCDTLVLLEAASHIPEKKKGPQVSPLFLYSTNPTCSCLILFFSFLSKKKKEM